MLKGEKILITGPAGRIAFGLCRALARDNEVWGIARFSDPATREKVESVGVTTRVADLGAGRFDDVPTDFTVLLHLAASMELDDDYEKAIRANAEGTGLLLQHCRKARAALVMSTVSIYKPHPDPWYAFRETDPIGDQLIQPVHYSISKIAEEAVTRYCARALDLPITIARMGSAYGDQGGLPIWHLHAIAAGQPVETRWDPIPYAPIHDDDIADQIEALVGAASVPATIVNFCGDEPVTVQEWSAYFGELMGVEAEVVVNEIPGASRGSVGDVTKRKSITGPCKIHWKDGFRQMVEHYHPERLVG